MQGRRLAATAAAVAAVAALLVLSSPNGAAVAGGVVADLYAGTFENEQMKVELTRQGDGTYSGAIHFQGKRYPATARDAGGELAGRFESNGQSFDFTVAPGGGTAE